MASTISESSPIGPMQTSSLRPKRKWIGWEHPILPSTTEHLLREYSSGNTWDMRQLLVVLPSGLARRRLGELLAVTAKRAGKILYPPQIVTAGALPEQLYVAKYPFASDLLQQLAWMHALRATPSRELTRVVPVPPHTSATGQWLELAKVLSGVHRELASDRLDFGKVVAALGNHPEAPRWKTLAKIQRRYLDQLDNLQLWDIQTARLCALDFREPATEKKILVVGCVDLNRTQLGFLEQVADQVEVWTAAPASAGELFDEYGTLISHMWQEFELNVPSQSLLVGNSPSDQAELTCACLAELGGRFHAREVTLGVPDPNLIPELKRQFNQSSVHARYGPGTPLIQSEPAILLSQIGAYVDTRSFASFATLIRHPAVHSLLQNRNVDLPADWLSQIDAYYQASLPRQIDGFINDEADGAGVVRTLVQAIDRWLSKLLSRPKNISGWVQPLLSVLGMAYEKQQCDLDDPLDGPLYAAASQLSQALLSLSDIPVGLEPAVSIAELLDWLLSSIAGKLVPEPGSENSVEMLGWLELALDDAPVLIVTGMHDGVVPESVNSDAFLPNGLRRQLGMLDNARRYARDMYSLQVMLASRAHLRIIVGQTDAQGDPLVPSRLLMACDLAELPDQVLHLVGEDGIDTLPSVEQRWRQVRGEGQLIVPRPVEVKPPRQISVTAFRDYLLCPYRFYLCHILRLRGIQDVDAELTAAAFGNLLHNTLQQLGSHPAGRSTDAEEVERFLLQTLRAEALAQCGPNPPAAVSIQIEQAEQRLQNFAPLQAERAKQGWEIRFVEQGVDFEHNVLVGHQEKLRLIGRIDRIDYHPATGQWAVWDYKTSESAKQPVAIHWSSKDGWKDLQLPLYRAVAGRLGVGENMTLGYITLPKQAADTGFHLAKFTPEQLQEADRLADEVASKVAACEFWPEKIEAVRYDDFRRICQADVQHVVVEPPPRRTRRHQPLHRVSPATVTQASALLAAPLATRPSLGPLLIRASAGTGKTFQLTNRLLQIILSGQEVDHILASTFTRKAAGEIMHRVLQRLARGCVDEKTRGELTQHVPGVDTSAAGCLAALRRVTRAIHRLRIGTLDSFFAQVARTFSLEMGLPAGWNAMDPIQEPRFQMRAIGQLLDNHERRTLVDLVRMLAKGESGRQVSDQLQQTVAAGYTAFRATHADAWDQLPLPPAPSEAALNSALVLLEAARCGHKKIDEQLGKVHLAASGGNWEAVIAHGIYSKLDEEPPTYYGRELDTGLVEALSILRQRAATELLAIRRNQTLASYKVLEAYDAEYTALLRRERALAFSDVTYYLSRWMNTNAKKRGPSNRGQQLEFRLDCGVQHLLLDEFQDTAPEQWQVLQPLARPLGGQADSLRSFFCVGDTKQAIYGWRGGVAEIFDSVSSTVDGLAQQALRDSFRSSPQVMGAVNEVFSNLPKHTNFAGCDAVAQCWSNDFPEHRTTRKRLEGYVRLQNGPKLDNDTSPEERKAIFLQFSVRQIVELTQRSTASIGVLFRTNADVARMISLLRDQGVSASQDGGNPLTDSAAVELVLSLVHLADHPGDSICAFHLGTSPLAAKLPLASRSHPSELAAWFRREVLRRGLGAAVEEVANRLADSLSWWDQHRLVQLIRAAYEYQPSFNGRLREFEESVMRGRVALPTEAQVKVMTIHKSKGLEFDAVILPDLDIEFQASTSLLVFRGDDPCRSPDGVLRYMNSSLQAMLPEDWQHAFNVQKQRGITESLCLLYVAMTRARQALYMTARPTSRGALQAFGSLLQSTLGRGESTSLPEAVLYEEGNSAWYQAEFRRTEARVTPADTSGELKISLRTDAESAPARGLRVAAPSSIIRTFEPVPLASAFSFNHSLGATYGTLIHAFFEQIVWLDDFQLDPQRLRRVALATIEPEALRHLSLDRVIEEFAEMLNLASVRAALSRKRHQLASDETQPDHIEIDNERVISLVMDHRLISGTIDRLALLMKQGKPIAAEIIDFKTDAYDPSMSLLWLEDRIQHHRPQLEVYAQVVSQLFDLPRENIATYLVMLSTDDLARCD